MAEAREAWITGIGLVSCLGESLDAHWQGLSVPSTADTTAFAPYVVHRAVAVDLDKQIPSEIAWVLRVDGHTDVRPINSPLFKSNWELSSARAISVVQYLISLGVPAQRLVAAGFAEFQPLDTAATEDAYKRNRRIELKLTER